MTIHFNGPLPAGTTVNVSRGRTTIQFGMGGPILRFEGEEIHFEGGGGGRRRSGGRNRGRGTNRQHRQRRHETERAPQRAGNQLGHPSQLNPSARTAELSPTLKNINNPAEKANTSNPPKDIAKPSLPTKNTEGSRGAKNTWCGLTGTADYEASHSTGKATEIRSFAKTVETSWHAQTTQHDFT